MWLGRFRFACIFDKYFIKAIRLLFPQCLHSLETLGELGEFSKCKPPSASQGTFE